MSATGTLQVGTAMLLGDAPAPPFLLALAHPGLLAAGAALVAVPILIHLFFRRRHRVVRWAAMDFLLAALRKQKRRMQVENLILLLIRCALIALLALALARPSTQALALSPFGGARATVLIIDTSASMAARRTGRTALDRASERAKTLLGDLPSESRVTILVSRDDSAGGAPRALIENASPDEARARLTALRTSHGPNSLAEVLRLAGRKLRELSGKPMAVLLTDLQRRDWRMDDAQRSGWREDVYASLRALGRGGNGPPAPVVVLDVGAAGTGNVAIASLLPRQGRQAFAGERLHLGVKLFNFGPTEVEGHVVPFIGREGEEGWTKLDPVAVQLEPTPGEGLAVPTLARVGVSLRDIPVGAARIRAVFQPLRGAGDRLASDSTRLLSIRVRPPVRFLPVRSHEGALRELRDAVVSPIDLGEPIYPAEFGDAKLERYDVVLLADPALELLEPAAIQKLERFVRAGGGLLAYLGTFAEPDKVNELFYKEKSQGLFPMMLATEPMRIDDESEIRFVPSRERDHPLFRETYESVVFFSPHILGFRRVADEFLVDPKFRQRHVVATYDTEAQDAAVIEHRLGRGRVVIITTTPDERAIRMRGSILPAVMFFNAAHFLSADDPKHRNGVVGTPIRVPLPPGAREVIVEPPEAAGGRIQEPVEDETKPFVVHNTGYPGFYRIRIRGSAGDGAGLARNDEFLAARNVDADEGDLRRIDAEELKRGYQGKNLHFTEDIDSVAPRGELDDRDSMSRILLGLVALLLLAELVLAGRFGSRRRSA